MLWLMKEENFYIVNERTWWEAIIIVVIFISMNVKMKSSIYWVTGNDKGFNKMRNIYQRKVFTVWASVQYGNWLLNTVYIKVQCFEIMNSLSMKNCDWKF
jgi:hypothetical protein